MWPRGAVARVVDRGCTEPGAENPVSMEERDEGPAPDGAPGSAGALSAALTQNLAAECDG